jgi:hypothetical protein
MSFFNSFLENIQNDNNIILDKKYYNIHFKNYILNYFNDNFEITNKREENNKLIILVYNYLIVYLNKPQRLLKDNSNYYIAIDLLTNIKYICFKNFCILDFDINKNNFTNKNDILEYLDNNKLLNNLVYYRVETERGYHIYLLDKPRLYSDIDTFYFLNNFESDIYYKFYCYIRGFSIRLSFKDNDNYIYKSIKLINKNKIKPSIELLNLFNKHIEYFDKKT